MSSLESLIHSAAEAAAAEIGPADIPPLRLTGADTATPRSRHWWLTPLAAAASVAAVLAGLIFVGHAPVTGHGGAWPGSAALSRAQARLTKLALDSYFPATGAQYTAGLAFVWTRQKILARDIGPCLAAAGFQQPPFSVPKRKFILHSGDNSQFPDLAQRLRTGVMTPGNGNRSGHLIPVIPKAQRRAHTAAMRRCVVQDARPIWRLDKAATPLAAIWLKKVTGIQSSPQVQAARPAFVSCLEAAGVPSRYAKRGGVGSSPLFAGFFAWMDRLEQASPGPGQVAGEQRIWTPVFVTCARPAVATMERLQLTERSAFFRQHAGQIRTIRRLVIDLLPRHQT